MRSIASSSASRTRGSRPSGVFAFSPLATLIESSWKASAGRRDQAQSRSRPRTVAMSVGDSRSIRSSCAGAEGWQGCTVVSGSDRVGDRVEVDAGRVPVAVEARAARCAPRRRAGRSGKARRRRAGRDTLSPSAASALGEIIIPAPVGKHRNQRRVQLAKAETKAARDTST